MNHKVNIRGTEYHVYTETREGTSALCVIFEKGEEGTMGYGQESVPVRKHQTVEQVYSKMYNQRIEADNERKWREEIAAIPLKEKHLHKDFAYFRRKNYGVAMYFRNKWSPTGVYNMGGWDEKEFDESGLGSKHGVAQRNDF